MRSRMIVFCLGIIYAGNFSHLPSLTSLLLTGFVISLLVFFLLFLYRHYGFCGNSFSIVENNTSAEFSWLAFFLFLGVFWACAWGQNSLSRVLPTHLEGRDIWVTGEIVGLPDRSGRALQFEFIVDKACLELPRTLSLDTPTSDTLKESKTKADIPNVDNSSMGIPCHNDTVGFHNRRLLLNYYDEEKLVPGTNWLFQVRLNRPHGFANPGVFDYEAWLFEKRISAKGYVRSREENRAIGDGSYSLSRLRYLLREKLLQATDGLKFRGIMLALTVGDKSLISSEQWQLFNDTGTSHLVVISGLHVGFVALLAFRLIGTMARLFPPLLLYVPAQTIAAFGAIIAAFSYSLLAGFSLPTQRAFIMITLFMLGRIVARNFPVSLVLCIALTVILILSPLAAINAGFWLSFVAVASLLFVFTGPKRPQNKMLRDKKPLINWSDNWWRSQLVVFVGLIVPLAIWTQQVSLLAPLANILAIPLVSLLLVPVCLAATSLLMLSSMIPVDGSFSENVNFVNVASANLASLDLADITAMPEYLAFSLFRFGDLLVKLLLDWLTVLNHAFASAGHLTFYGISTISSICAAFACLLLLMPRGWGCKYLSLPLLLPLLFPVIDPIMEGTAEIDVLDVGQGLSVLVRTKNHSLVYDTGPRLGANFDTGRAVVIPVLRKRGVTYLDTLIISHSDNDHSGGADSVLSLVEVGSIKSGSKDFTVALNTGIGKRQSMGSKFSNTTLSRCNAGEHWTWDGVDFTFLYPALNSFGSETNAFSGTQTGNNSSCVLLIESGNQSSEGDSFVGAGQSLLLPGDIEKKAERALIREYGGRLASTVLLAPHHGSNTSSTEGFVDATSPQVVIYSSGYRSQFGHPTALVQERYRKQGAAAYNTAVAGTLSFTLGVSGVDLTVRSFRLDKRHYWFSQ